MKVQVEPADFAEMVGWAARTLPSRATTQLQVLSGLLLEAADGRLTVSAYDYEVAARGDLPATVQEPGRVLVTGRLLAEISRALPVAPVDLSVDGTRLVVACGNALFRLPLLPTNDYPALPELPPAAGTIEGAAFAAAVAQVAIAAGRDDTLPVLTGVRIEIEGDTLTLAATDRYRLAVRTMKWRPDEGSAPMSALVPARTLTDVAKTMPHGAAELTVAFGADPSGMVQLAGFAAGPRQTTTRLLDGQFPPFRKLLPDSCPLTAQLDIAPLADAIRRVALVAAKTAPVQLKFTAGLLTLEAGTGGEAQASESLPVLYAGPDLSVALNPSYLLDGLGALDDDVATIGFASADDPELSANKPAVLTGKPGAPDEVPNYRYLIMPIRLHG